MKLNYRLILFLAATLTATAASAAPTTYVVSNGSQFGTIDLTTGTFTPIGPGAVEGNNGLTRGPGGGLYTLTFSGNLSRVDPTTGNFTTIGATGLGDCSNPGAACGANSANVIGSLGSQLYATDFANNLYSVNSTSGAATLVGSTGIGALPFTPATFNPDGTLNVYDETLFSANGKLYATFDASTIDFSTFTVTAVIADNLFELDPITGAATLIGPTTQAISAVLVRGNATLAFNASTGEIMGLDLSNGNTRVVGYADPAVGLVSGAVSATPEPSSLALLGTGLAAVAASFNRRLRGARQNT